MRHDLQLDPPLAVDRVEGGRRNVARKGADHLAHAPGADQAGQAGIAVANIVGDDRKISDALSYQGVKEVVRAAGRAEAAAQDRRPVRDARDGLVEGADALVDHWLAALALSAAGRRITSLPEFSPL